MKKGKYVIKAIRESFFVKPSHLVYVIKCARSNASYEWSIDHLVIDEAIRDKAITVPEE